MQHTYGRRGVGNNLGHDIQLLAGGDPVPHPIGITVDWDEVDAVTEDTLIAGGTTVPNGQKYLRFGQVMVKSGDKYVPWNGQAMKRGETVVLNRTVFENGSLSGFTAPASDHPHAIDGGLIWKDRLITDQVAGAGVGLQSETNTIVGTIGAAGAGNMKVTVTADGLTGSPVVVSVALANNDTPAQSAVKARTALGLNGPIAAMFAIGGTGADLKLTKIVEAPNDATLNIAIENDTTTDIVDDLASVNTTAGLGVGTGPALADLQSVLPMLRYV